MVAFVLVTFVVIVGMIGLTELKSGLTEGNQVLLKRAVSGPVWLLILLLAMFRLQGVEENKFAHVAILLSQMFIVLIASFRLKKFGFSNNLIAKYSLLLLAIVLITTGVNIYLSNYDVDF